MTPTNTPTVTPTASITPTPTQSVAESRAAALISSTSDPFDGCGETVDTLCYISNTSGTPGSEVPTTSSVVYLSPTGPSTFTGDGDNYKIEMTGSGSSYSFTVDGSGNVGTPISICL